MPSQFEHPPTLDQVRRRERLGPDRPHGVVAGGGSGLHGDLCRHRQELPVASEVGGDVARCERPLHPHHPQTVVDQDASVTTHVEAETVGASFETARPHDGRLDELVVDHRSVGGDLLDLGTEPDVDASLTQDAHRSPSRRGGHGGEETVHRLDQHHGEVRVGSGGGTCELDTGGASADDEESITVLDAPTEQERVVGVAQRERVLDAVDRRPRRAGARRHDDGVGLDGAPVDEFHGAVPHGDDGTHEHVVAEVGEGRRGPCDGGRAAGNRGEPRDVTVLPRGVDDRRRDICVRRSSGGVQTGIATTDDEDSFDAHGAQGARSHGHQA